MDFPGAYFGVPTQQWFGSAWVKVFSRCLGAWGLALGVALFLCALAGTATAAPFERTFAYTQPDGTAIELWGRGDEFHAVFETLDGYTVVFDPAARAYFYAELSADRRELRSTGVRVGQSGGAPHGEKHLRIDPAAARAQALARHRVWDASVQVSKRWTSVKAQARARMEAARSGVAYAPPEQPTTGQKVGLCLLVDFPDEEATIPQATIDAMLNGDTFTEFGNVYSVKRYYEEVSDGHLTFTNVVTAYIRAPHPKSYYNDVEKDAYGQGRLLLGDVLAVLKARPDYESVILPTLSALDVDGDQNVLAVSLLFAGENSGVWTYGLWEHAWALPEPVELGNGKRVYYYQFSPMGAAPVIGVFCHETAHMLCGFPDLYDYGYQSAGVGYWGLMALGCHLKPPAEVCAYLKYKAGWASSVTTLTRTSSLVATVRAGVNEFYLYPKNGDPAATEYFIVENRQKSGVDADLPGAGVCIWHVDEAGSNDEEAGTPERHYECSLVQADGLRRLELFNDYGDACDPYYADNPAPDYANVFSDAEIPNAKWWDGSSSGAIFHDFSASGPTMTFRVGASDPAAPAILSAKAESRSVIDLAWVKNAAADEVLVAWSDSDAFGTPTGTYSPGDALAGGGTVLYVGNADGLSHVGLSSSTRYYYKVWSHLAGGGYSAGVARAANTCPVNDHFANRILIAPALPASASGSTIAATKEDGEPAHWGASARASAWWSWTAPHGGPVSISTAGSSFDTRLAVYTGDSLESLRLVVRNDDDLSMGLTTSRTAFWADAGTTYQIAVDGYGFYGFNGLGGDVQLSLAVQAPPEVATPPSAQAVLPGEAARFTVAANSSVSLLFQWQVSTDGGLTWADVSDGALYSGATTGTLSVLATTAAMGGYQYRCVISDTVSPAIASAPATLTVRWSRFAALSARGPVGTGEQTLILGFVYASGGKPTLVRGVGPGLFMSVRGYLRDPQLRLFASDGTEVARNDDWAGTPALAEAFARTGAGPIATTSKDSALVEALTGNLYTAHVTGAAGTTGVALAEVYDADLTDKTKRLAALSVRSQVGAGESLLIAGFVLAGDAPRQVVVRAVGPGLTGSVANYLANPEIKLWRLAGGEWTLVDSNDDWSGSADDAAAFAAAGMGALTAGSKDAALLVTLEPGIYTLQVNGAAGTSGVALVEIYEAAP